MSLGLVFGGGVQIAAQKCHEVGMSRRTIDLTDALWEYLVRWGTRESGVLSKLREITAQLPGAGMQISPEQGQFLGFLVKALGVRNALEIGVFTGYSGLVVAQALPEDGRWVGCDVNAETSELARRAFADAGLEERFDLRLGPARKTLQAMLDEGKREFFDFAFIDADKENYVAYYDLCLELLRPGGVMAFDNVLWGGAVADPTRTDADTLGIRALNRRVHEDRSVTHSMLPVGDGLMMVCKRPSP